MKMKYKLHETLQQLRPYEVASDECRIRLDANESFLDPGVLLKDKIIQAVSSVPLNRYPDDNCSLLRAAIGKRYGVSPDQIVAGNGSDELIALLIGSFLQPEETLLIPSPDFSMYTIFAATFGRKVELLKKDKNLEFTAEEAIKRLEETGAKAFLFSNPFSPSSTVLAREEVRRIADATDALIIVDEAYMDFSDQTMLWDKEIPDNLVVLRTCSKAMGCAAIRLGFAVASYPIANVLHALRPPYNLNAITQAIGCVILSEEQYLKDVLEQILASRDQLQTALSALTDGDILRRTYTSDTNYLYVESEWSNEIYHRLKQRSILVRNFGCALRITAGSFQENEELIEQLTEILTEIKSDTNREDKNQ
jgi:histidinol-phosphate aminotransferase